MKAIFSSSLQLFGFLICHAQVTCLWPVTWQQVIFLNTWSLLNIMESLQSALDTIKLEVPEMQPRQSSPQSEEPPESYRTNSKKEQLLVRYAENFRRQFRKLYGDRKALFLTPLNECGVEKFICTTLRVTQLPYKELYNYDGCAEFVADYLTYDPLEVPNELPKTLVSPTMVLKQQKGNCFDYSVLLASLLIGVGYDAYCVCGYADQEVTLLNQMRKACPQLQEKSKIAEGSTEEKARRYAVRPPRDLNSRFLARQEEKQGAKVEEEKQKKLEEEEARIAEVEKPPPDRYHGMRFHCWVLVLAGKREVAQGFFLEPTTGEPHPLDWEGYLGIESLWNGKNYWVNMQDCSQGVKMLQYDLGDATRWEFFFPNVERPLLVVPGVGEEGQAGGEEEKEEEEQEGEGLNEFELPPSWVQPIKLSPRELETRCPRGQKTVLYRKAKLEKFAEYLNQDGLVSRLTTYGDAARTQKIETRNSFSHRGDHLQTRVENSRSGQVQECFGPGRLRALKEHIYSRSLKTENRTMQFYSHARVDGLVRRERTATEMTEHFERRPDYLHYRQVTYQRTAPARRHEFSEEGRQRPIVKIVERFHHNPAVPPNSDVAERFFLLSENPSRIRVVYHLEKNRVTSSSREFVVPPSSRELTFDPGMTPAYQVDPYAKEPKNRHLFEQLERLVRAQGDSIEQVRRAEKETQDILDSRQGEELNFALSISVYDVDRNETARQHKQKMEQQRAEEERIRREKEMDYLAPFLARIGDPPTLTREQMEEVTQNCLKDLRARLVGVANLIQARFERETGELQRKQAWYKANQGSLTKENEAEYISYCNDAMFRIHILEHRLNSHKATAPQKYVDLESRLRRDPRLAALGL